MRGRTNSSFTISMHTAAKQPGQSLDAINEFQGNNRGVQRDASGLFQGRGAAWWSRTESNRRHPACKAGALPTELRPHSKEQCEAQESLSVRVVGEVQPELVGPGRLELPTSRLSGVRSNQAELRAYGRTTAFVIPDRIRDRLAIARFTTPHPNDASP